MGYLVNPHWCHHHFPHYFETSHRIANHYQSEDSHAHQLTIQTLPVMLTIKPRMITIFRTHSPIPFHSHVFSTFALEATPSSIHTTYYHSNRCVVIWKSNRIRVVCLKGHAICMPKGENLLFSLFGFPVVRWTTSSKGDRWRCFIGCKGFFSGLSLLEGWLSEAYYRTTEPLIAGIKEEKD